MAKLTIKNVNNILNDFKVSLFISKSLETFKINHYDFFEFLKENKEFNAEYEKILNYNTILLEDQIAQQVYSKDGNTKILLEMIKAGNKNKYNMKQEIEVKNTYSELSDEELDLLIEKYKK